MRLRLFILTILVLLAPVRSWAAVVFDVASFSGFGCASCTTDTSSSFTVANVANRAISVTIGWDINSATSVTMSCGGVSGTAVSGADSGTTTLTNRVMMFVVVAPNTGAQTCTAAWTGTAGSMRAQIIVANGVDQTTPMNNGTFHAVLVTNVATHSITSTSGDLTTSGSMKNGGAPNQTTNQTDKCTSSDISGCDIGDGTGTQTHTWTGNGTDDIAMSGANFVQVSTAGGSTRLLMGVGQ